MFALSGSTLTRDSGPALYEPKDLINSAISDPTGSSDINGASNNASLDRNSALSGDPDSVRISVPGLLECSSASTKNVVYKADFQ